MPSPPLRIDFFDEHSPKPNEVSSDEYDRNADLTNQAFDNAATAASNAASALSIANAAVPASSLTETVQDIVGAAIVPGANITKVYDDTAGTITISATSGGGDASTNTSTSVDSEIALFSSTGGKTLKRATQTGILKTASGVIGTATAGTDYVSPTTIDAKGDLLVGTADNTIGKLTVGSNGQTQVADSSTTTGHAYLYPRPVSLAQPSIGGVGDNSTNNDAAFTAALAAIGNHGEIYVPPGIYRNNGFSLPAQVRVVGAGTEKTFLRNTHATNHSITIATRDCGVEGLTIDATAIRTGQAGINMNVGVNWSINRVTIENIDTGILHKTSYDGGYENIYIGNCTTGFQTVTGTGASTPMTATNMNIYNCGTGFQTVTGVSTLIAFGWFGGTIAACTTGLNLIGSEVACGFYGVQFEANTGDDVVLGDGTSGPTSILFANCGFNSHTTQARSIWARRGGRIHFDTCRWWDHLTLVCQQDSAIGSIKWTLPAFGGTVTHFISKNSIFYEDPPYDIEAVSSYGSLAGVNYSYIDVTSLASSASTLTIAPGKPLYAFTGTTATWTLPAIAGTVGCKPFNIKNRGSGALTISRAGSDQIYDTSAVSTISVAAGASAVLVNDGTYWVKV